MPDPTLQGTALRYAAGDLTPEEAAAFESRLAIDQEARDALAEAVRLSAAALGRPTPAPGPSFRSALRARLNRAGYRGHPFAWVGLGAAAVAASTLLALSLASTPPPAPGAPVRAEVAPAPHAPEAPAAPGGEAAPMPREASVPVAIADPPAPAAPGACGGDEDHRSVAEIWADLSTPEHVEKAHDDELRWRQHVRNLHPPHVSATAKGAAPDSPHP